MPTLMHVVGARPNFMKAAPVLRAIRAFPDARQILVHTGQHYDRSMSDTFFEELDLPAPDEHLGAGSGTHAEQTARIMLGFEPVLDANRPEWVLVYGDVNSTVACALVAAKKGVRVAHVEAGLRSRDRTMPEELNRVLTDQLADLLFTPSRDADDNLRAEGIPEERICFVGNVMVDTLLHLRERARARQTPEAHGVSGEPYAVVTLHRPANVDEEETLRSILNGLAAVAETMPVLFAVHPRTRQRLETFGLHTGGVRLLEPMGYLDLISLVDGAAVVLTDSGGLQEETTVLGVPCLTIRPNTERPITIAEGTNRLVASSGEAIRGAVAQVRQMDSDRSLASRPEGWDGQAAERIAGALLSAPIPAGELGGSR